jgi:hypothetical protein
MYSQHTWVDLRNRSNRLESSMNYFHDRKPVRPGQQRRFTEAVLTNKKFLSQRQEDSWKNTQIKPQYESIRHDPDNGVDWLAIALDQDRRRRVWLLVLTGVSKGLRQITGVDRTGISPFLTGGIVFRSEIKWCDASQMLAIYRLLRLRARWKDDMYTYIVSSMYFTKYGILPRGLG